ncbi:MAG: hypothetical protein ACJ72I_19405 [Pseudonocardiaceae bacterium]|jgi:hypothetical protein
MMWNHFIGRHTDEETHGYAADINRKLTARHTMRIDTRSAGPGFMKVISPSRAPSHAVL